MMDMLQLNEPYRAVVENDPVLLERMYSRFGANLNDMYPRGDCLCHAAFLTGKYVIGIVMYKYHATVFD